MGACQFPSVGTGTLRHSSACSWGTPGWSWKVACRLRIPLHGPWQGIALPYLALLSWAELIWICWMNFLWGQYLARLDEWCFSPLNFASESAELQVSQPHEFYVILIYRFDLEEVFPVSKSTPCHDMSLPWTRATVPRVLPGCFPGATTGATELRCLQRPTSPGARSAALCTVSLPALPMSCPKSSGRCSRDVSDVRGRLKNGRWWTFTLHTTLALYQNNSNCLQVCLTLSKSQYPGASFPYHLLDLGSG